jgi:hypothetical protein
VREAANREDVVLMKAVRDLTAPDRPSTELVQITAFGHENVAGTQLDSACNLDRHINGRNILQIQMTVLNIGDSEVLSWFSVKWNFPILE